MTWRAHKLGPKLIELLVQSADDLFVSAGQLIACH
jgi:hypothetical protein